MPGLWRPSCVKNNFRLRRGAACLRNHVGYQTIHQNCMDCVKPRVNQAVTGPELSSVNLKLLRRSGFTKPILSFSKYGEVLGDNPKLSFPVL